MERKEEERREEKRREKKRRGEKRREEKRREEKRREEAGEETRSGTNLCTSLEERDTLGSGQRLALLRGDDALGLEVALRRPTAAESRGGRGEGGEIEMRRERRKRRERREKQERRGERDERNEREKIAPPPSLSTFRPETDLVAEEDHVDMSLAALLDLVHPLGDVLERLAVGDRVDEEDALATAKVRRRDRLEALLPGSVPD